MTRGGEQDGASGAEAQGGVPSHSPLGGLAENLICSKEYLLLFNWLAYYLM